MMKRAPARIIKKNIFFTLYMLKNTEENVVLSYLDYRNIQNMGYLKYSHLCSMFCYILNNYHKTHVRKIFIKLVRSNHFIKKKNIGKKSYTYKFIPIASWEAEQERLRV